MYDRATGTRADGTGDDGTGCHHDYRGIYDYNDNDGNYSDYHHRSTPVRS